MHIREYFQEIEETIASCPSVLSKEILYNQRTQHIGFIKGILTFTDSSELHFKEFVDVEAHIVKYKYGYHYQKEDDLIFRYDNHPHIGTPNIPTTHKHQTTQENIAFSLPPTLKEVLDEILSYLPIP